MNLSEPLSAAPRDRSSFLIRRHQAAVWRYLRWLGCSREEADDLTQEVFLVLLASSFTETSDGATRSYLRTTARYLFLDFRRRKGETVDLELVEAVTDVERQRDRADLQEDDRLTALQRCLTRLDDRSRQVLDWYYRERESWEEIAARLGRKPNGIKMMLQRIRQRLRECVDRQMEARP